MDMVFTYTKNLLANEVEEGIKLFYPARVTTITDQLNRMAPQTLSAALQAGWSAW